MKRWQDFKNIKKSFYNKNRGLTTVFACLTAVALILCGCGSQPKVYRVGILSGADAFFVIADGFKTKMTELGYIQGKNIIYDIQALNTDPDGEQRIADKFVADKVDLIVAFPTEPAITVKRAAEGSGIPVIFVCANIEGSNLVESISHPGGNITGVRYPGPDLAVKRLEILLALAPSIKRVYAIYDINYPAIAPSLKVLRPAAASLGITLVEDPVRDLKELQAVLEKNSQIGGGIDAILIMPDILTQSPEGWALISRYAKRYRLPVAGSAGFEADSGALFSYIPDNAEMGGQAASQAEKIFKGTPAGSIFVITPESHLRLNYKLAKELDLAVSESILSLASEIIR